MQVSQARLLQPGAPRWVHRFESDRQVQATLSVLSPVEQGQARGSQVPRHASARRTVLKEVKHENIDGKHLYPLPVGGHRHRRRSGDRIGNRYRRSHSVGRSGRYSHGSNRNQIKGGVKISKASALCSMAWALCSRQGQSAALRWRITVLPRKSRVLWRLGIAEPSTRWQSTVLPGRSTAMLWQSVSSLCLGEALRISVYLCLG